MHIFFEGLTGGGRIPRSARKGPGCTGRPDREIVGRGPERKGQAMVILSEFGRRSRILSVAVALGLSLVAFGDNSILQDTVPPSTNNRPVYALLSVSDTFDLPPL